jgi:Zn finger protein HypA/HybF involved in hydrogenase expression
VHKTRYHNREAKKVTSLSAKMGVLNFIDAQQCRLLLKICVLKEENTLQGIFTAFTL